MAKGSDNEKTLASLWLKSRPANKPPSALPSGTATVASDSQMDLLFTPPNPSIVRSFLPQVEPTGAHAIASRLRTVDPEGEAPSSRKSHSRSKASEDDRAPIGASEHRIWSVRDLVAGIREQVEQEYQDIWVEGEISNCRPAPSGHVYFTLKDGDAQLPVVLFRREAQLLRFRPQDGLAVLVRGRISVYESRGQLQLVAETVEPRGTGALQLAFEQLKARLRAEGLFDAARKRPLPAFPHCIGVATSAGGAVLHDIVKVIRRRHARLNLLIYPAVVQGQGCAESVAAAIRWFNKRPPAKRRAGHEVPKADLILIARGGGSMEDLAGFNDETLARAIAASALPVVSAIGHETDFTIADFVADLRAPTPSAAAELITAAQHRIEERVQVLDSRIDRAIRYQIILAHQRFTALSFAQIHNRLQALIGRRAQRLDDLWRRVEAAAQRSVDTRATRLTALISRLQRQNPGIRLVLARRRLERAEQDLGNRSIAITAPRLARLRHASARLHALSPLAVLGRGYALVYATDGILLRSAGQTHPGQILSARLAKGSLTARVETTIPE